ncbi:MAG: NAD-dependent epimerase/dehydratase family protein [Actinomycetes bacterium]
MRILIIGGTRFVGRHIVESAVAHGHHVTLLHRGSSGDDPFPQCEHLHVDRDGDLSVLSDRSFDAVVDVSAYVPRQVNALADALGDRAGRYLYISTVSVYDLPVEAPFDEQSKLTDPPAEPTTEDVTEETYGGLKVLCERAARDRFGDRLTVVRPTYVVGPFDYTHRFTYWVERLARGGEVLAPGPADAWLQVIDARDQGAFVVRLLEDDVDGTFHTVWPGVQTATFGDVLAEVSAAVAPAGTTITWVDPQFLREHEVDGTALPLWDDSGEESGAPALPDAALAAGLSPRPVGQSASELLAAERAEPTVDTYGVGLSPDREAELLAQWHAAQSS